MFCHAVRLGDAYVSRFGTGSTHLPVFPMHCFILFQLLPLLSLTLRVTVLPPSSYCMLEFLTKLVPKYTVLSFLGLMSAPVSCLCQFARLSSNATDCGLNSRHLLSHNSVDYKSKTKVPTGLVSSENLLLVWWAVPSHCVLTAFSACVTVLVSS